MRLPRLRHRIRTLLLLVALVALALIGQRIYQDGPEAHWLLLKLRYGTVAARRSATIQARKSEGEATFHDFTGPILFGPPSARALEAQWRHRHRRAKLLLPALADAAKDPDPSCRANALRALNVLASLHASESDKLLTLRQIVAATRDPDDSVRTAAVSSLGGLADRDTSAAVDAIRSVLTDPSVEVRLAATRELGMLGVIIPATQPDAASILIPLLASREDSRVRIGAAWGLFYFGVDRRRHPPGTGPDVVPALVAALHDLDVDVRRAAAMILGSTTFDARGRLISSWDRRKAQIVPTLNAAISDDDKAVREESALAMFALGQRDSAIIELIEQAAREPDRPMKARFESAVRERQAEQKPGAHVEPATPENAKS
jgi:HEAT repeat protein